MFALFNVIQNKKHYWDMQRAELTFLFHHQHQRDQNSNMKCIVTQIIKGIVEARNDPVYAVTYHGCLLLLRIYI
jgi:hypothetical protein